ncbi:ELM1/GtrOC1 family putative glycosyltransferase [Sulfurimonas sp.]|uniref:ELM1/GtrOC1 family putative glycosyltransferase n=1 Tax=Sulfurimonas sp. TaxID=2022749 RepID=UPI00261375A8|nr:ELM1/GtrOC1 family putative glycosyltransferase [Sulfurimonas sp.]MDD3452635.1 ELM1/GtrOC1 family putative glycosyltransferase [Sulfurimonas sp.]
MNVLVIKDNKPGHYNQTEGIVLALQEIYPDLKIDDCEIEIKNKISRKLLRYLLNALPFVFKNQNSLKYIKYFYEKFALPANRPDLIVSTGGNTSNLNAWLSLAYGAKNILNGALRGLHEELFTCITTVIDLGYKNQVILDVAPNTVTQEILKKEADVFSSLHHLDKNETYYTLLVGGDGSGYKYDVEFYSYLVEFIKKVSEERNVKWLITTSRRTPLEIEQKLKQELDRHSAYFVEYHKQAEKVLLPYLGLCEAVFVTEDSSSMISEAISARKKETYVLGAEHANPDKNYQKILEKFSEKGHIKRIKINKFLDFQKTKFTFLPLAQSSIDEIAMKLKFLL